MDMPFVGSKVNVKISSEKEEIIKTKLGKVIEILGKSEKYLMVGFEDNCRLYFAGERPEKCAFIEVKLFGKAEEEAYRKLTKEICKIYEEELGIPQDKIYVKYEEVSDWGWNGFNF